MRDFKKKKLKLAKLDLSFSQLAAVAASSIVLIIGVAVLLVHNHTQATKLKSQASQAPVDSCAISHNLTYSCYKSEIDKIVKQSSPEKATALVKAAYPKISFVASECHQLMHIVGRDALLKYNDLGEAYVHGDHFCASGFYHGASEEIVAQKGADYIVKNASSVCSYFAKKHRYSLDHYNCVHGLGHGFMEALDEDVPQSLSACDALGDTWEEQSCYSGVFMQNIMITQIQSDESYDHTSKYLKTDDLMYPCNSVAEKYKSGCYIIQTSWALPQVKYDYAKVFGLCAQEPEAPLREICYQSLGRDASGLQGYNLSKTRDTCMLGASGEAISNCIVGAAKDIVYQYHGTKQANQFCASLEQSLQANCVATVKNFYTTFL